MIKILLWMCCLAVQNNCWKLNLALNKRSYLSSLYKEHYARYAVDGNVNGNMYAHANDERGWFVVDLGRQYQVEYIVFYRRSSCPGCDHRMDNFIVGLSNNFDPQINNTLEVNYQLCGQLNGSLGLIAAVQCQDKDLYSRYVIIQQDFGKDHLTISEVEVIGEYINYVGCFDTLMHNITVGSSMSIKECINTCENMSYFYAAIQERKCICGNETKHYSPLSECNVLCPGGVDYCGSSKKLSVYEVFPLKFLKNIKRKYIGCFIDNNDDRDLIFGISGHGSMTLDMCQKDCIRQNYLFFGVQFRHQCFCGNKYGKHGVNETSCHMECPGNNSQICGDACRNSIYAVYPEQGASQFFRNNHHCKNGAELDLDGICGNKECEDGWIGEDCSMRDCSTYNGDCGVHECKKMNGTAGVFSECICKEGFDKRFWLDYCHDVNECEEKTHKCNTTISTCTNKEGSYECNCFTGLQNSSFHECTDIDECKTDNQCNTTTTICQNTFRSYFCECKEGFTNESLYNCRDINECQDKPHVCNLTVSNCTNTFGSYECQCLEEGLVYDNNESICRQPYASGVSSSIKLIISLVCAIVALLFVVIITTIALLKNCRKKLPESFTKIILVRNQKNDDIKEADTVEFRELDSEAISLFELKNYYQLNKTRLLSNFEKIPQVAQIPTNYGKNVKLKPKNKYKNILPFDMNRVVLKELQNEELSDYINASFIPSFQETFQFIAAQGPIKETVYDFWRMILEYKVEIIVMLTNCLEKGKVKCVQYWPDNNSKDVNGIIITFKNSKIWSTYEIRKFIITKDDSSLEVTHMLYNCWFDHKIPENMGSMLNFHNKMKSLVKQDLASPIVVHCSAGVGRTGTFLALDRLLQEAQQTGMVDVFKCLKFLRSHRNYMIQTKIQFTFCFDVLNFYHELGSTTSVKLSDDLNIRNRSDYIEKEFQWILQNVASNEEDGTLKRKNRAMNFTFPGCVQNSTYEIRLESETSWQKVAECCADENDAITILVDDFIEKKSHELPYSSKNRNLYLTEKFSRLSLQHFELVTAGCDEHIYSNTDKINIFAIPSNSFEQLRHLWSAIKQMQVKQKTLLIYADDLNRAGFVVCALNLLEMMDAAEEIEVFQVVYQLKSLIPHFMENIDRYRSLYSFAEYFLPATNEQFYSNFV